MPSDEFVTIVVYDITGKEIKVPENENHSAGTYETLFDASLYPSSVYYYKITTKNYNEARKMILIR